MSKEYIILHIPSGRQAENTPIFYSEVAARLAIPLYVEHNNVDISNIKLLIEEFEIQEREESGNA